MGDDRLVAGPARALLAALALLAAGCSGGDDSETTAAQTVEPEPQWMRLQPGGATSCARGDAYSFWVRRHAARVLAAYPGADVAVLGDSLTLPFARPLDLSLAGGPGSLSAELLVRDLAQANPQTTFARFNYANDAIQRRFDAPIQPSRTPFEQRLRAAETRLKRLPNHRSYLACGTEHCVLPDDAFYSLAVDGVRVRDWVADLASGRDVDCPTCRGR